MQEPNETERKLIIGAIFGNNLKRYANTPQFAAYFRHYCSVVCPASSGDAVIALDTSSLWSHDDILNWTQVLIKQPTITFKDFIEHLTGKSNELSVKEKEHMARVTVGILFGIDCMLRDYYSFNQTQREMASQRIKWEMDTPFVTFIENAFTCSTAHAGNTSYQQEFNTRSMKAWKLVKRYGITIRRTNNLLEHLELDRKTMTLTVFHQMSFLRAHLTKTKEEPLDLSFEESIKRGSLPPRLLLETVHTFYGILFPVTNRRDKKSRALLKSMIRKEDFDSETKEIEFVRKASEDMTFHYWGHRLAALHEIIKKPPPANAMVAWFERHTSERNALTVAILGLFLSALFGMLSFIVGMLQFVLAWVAYKKDSAK
ncbi:hypothetical protein QBC38DRAFT_280405 [Podospora fimiseda]|uniref:Uncharacterized protein n=1 Tax=Podospora fimiseda TaxID=252190 RepID=A0AAN7GR90_9PEZI|nr:hypothetical protein QBC38DRAFT_280405 [Podospora fimiseda]